MAYVLLILGLIFPLLSWLSFITVLLQSLLTGKPSSGVYIPFIGPILIDCWILTTDFPAWALIIPWLADVGTLFFLSVLPMIICELCRTSRFTRLFLLKGAQEAQTVSISFHRGGFYVMKREWQRSTPECGITMSSDPGTYEREGDDLILLSHTGAKITLSKIGNTFLVADNSTEDTDSLDQWVLLEQEAEQARG